MLGYKRKKEGRTVAELMGVVETGRHIRHLWFSPLRYRSACEAATLQVKKGVKRLKMVVVCMKMVGKKTQEGSKRFERRLVHIELMIDANYKFSPVDAKQLCRSNEDCDLTWFEELCLQMTPKH